MSEIKGRGILVIALLLAVGGIGLGGYSTIQVVTGGLQGPPGADGVDGTDGQDAPGYYCSTGSELQNAIDTIGSGTGRIFITDDITLNATIDVDGGGNYNIQGAGAFTVDCGGDRQAFYITDAGSCILRDFKINASLLTTDQEIIHITEGNNNSVYIQNIQILGDNEGIGVGIYIQSENVWIQNCYIFGLRDGINSIGGYAHISENTIEYCSFIAIWIIPNGHNGIIESNYLYYNYIGIAVESDDNIVANNLIYNTGRQGISVAWANRNVITGNIIAYDYVASLSDNTGIVLISADYNTISNNGIFYFTNPDTGTGYGMYLSGSLNNENIITGNNLQGNEVNTITGSIGDNIIVDNNEG